MDNVILYIMQSQFSLVLLFSLYMLVLRKHTNFRFNRLFLLLSVIASALIPLIDFSFANTEALYYVQLPEIEIGASRQAGQTAFKLNTTNILLLIYAVISFILMIKITRDLISIFRLKNASKKLISEQHNIKYLVNSVQNFSFFNWIFIRETDQKNSSVLEHEKAHSCLLHSLDIIIIKIFQCVFWINPLSFFIEKELRLQHEYEADKWVLGKHLSILDYQQLLLNQVFQTEFNLITNNFNQSFLKNRFTMMTKKETKKVRMLLPVVLLITIPIIVAYGINTKKIPSNESSFKSISEMELLNNNSAIKETQKDTSQKFMAVEIMPEFPGGEEALIKFISSNLVYPEEAKKEEVTGKCFIRFVVEKNGSIADVEVIRSVGHEITDKNKKAIAKQCDDEAVRVIKIMPKWKPGKQRGKKVRVEYQMPISFNLGPKKDSKK